MAAAGCVVGSLLISDLIFTWLTGWLKYPFQILYIPMGWVDSNVAAHCSEAMISRGVPSWATIIPTAGIHLISIALFLAIIRFVLHKFCLPCVEKVEACTGIDF